MSSPFRHLEGKRKKVNADLDGICSADVTVGGSWDWRVGPAQYTMNQIHRKLGIDYRKIRKLLKQLKINSYWYGQSEIVRSIDFAKLKIYLNK